MPLPIPIDRMDARLDAIEAALTAALPTRLVSDTLQHYTERSDAELTQGVVTLVSADEKGYSQNLGMAARDGTQRILLIGHLRVAEGTPRKAIQDQELDLIEELKAFIRAGVPGMSLTLDSVIHSRQLDHPYGWVVAYIDAAPPRQTTY